MKKHRFLTYALRWQASTPILALCIAFLPFNTFWKTIIANAIGACMFFPFDRWLFTKQQPKRQLN